MAPMGGARSAIVSSGGPAIPDSEEVHTWYAFDELDSGTTSNIPDKGDNGHDLTNGSFSGVAVDINGVQAGEFDGTDDGIWSETFSSISQPFTALAVVEQDDDSSDHQYLTLQDGSVAFSGWDGSEWWLYGGESVYGSSESGSQLVTMVFDEGSSFIREDGSETASGDGGSRDMNVIGVGSREPDRDTRYWDGKIGEIIVYDHARTADEIESDEQYLADKWGVTI